MSRRVSTSAEALEAAAHPDGLLRGLAARRAFTEIIGIQAACRRCIARRRFLGHSDEPFSNSILDTIASTTDSAVPSSSRTSLAISRPSASLSALNVSSPPVPHDGPEHTLVYLAMEVKSTMKDTLVLSQRITDITSEIALRSARFLAVQAHVATLQKSIGYDCVPITAVEALQAEVDERNRELEGWIGREAAGRGKLLQLQAKAQSNARLHAQWHRKRSNTLEHYSPVDAEHILKESIVRAEIFVKAAVAEHERVRVRDKVHTSQTRGESQTRVKLSRKRSPLAPVKKAESSKTRRPSSASGLDAPKTLKTKRSTRSIAPPPSAFPGESQLPAGGAFASSSDDETAFTPKRRSRPTSVVVAEENREEMNAKLVAFYAPRPKSPSKGPGSHQMRKPSSSSPPSTSASVLEEISNTVFKDISFDLDLDLKLPNPVPVPALSKAPSSRKGKSNPSLPLPLPRASTNGPPPSAFRASSPPSSPPPPSPSSQSQPQIPKYRVKFGGPLMPSPLARRLSSRRENRHSIGPIPTSTSAPILAPLALATEPILPPIARTNRPEPLRSMFHADPESTPSLSSLMAPSKPAGSDNNNSDSTKPNHPFARSTTSTTPAQRPGTPVPVPEWLNELLTPLQPPTDSGTFTELVLDLHIPSYNPSSRVPGSAPAYSSAHKRDSMRASTPPGSVRDEWDVVSTSPFADRDSFHITYDPPPTDETKNEQHQPAIHRKVAKLRNRASYILPKARTSSSIARPDPVQASSSTAGASSATAGGLRPAAGAIPSKSEEDVRSPSAFSPPPPPSAFRSSPNGAPAVPQSKWRKRLSLVNVRDVLSHRGVSANVGGDPISPTAEPRGRKGSNFFSSMPAK